MSTALYRNSLANLATQINDAHLQVESALRDAVAHAIRVGELLRKAKTKVPHGQWNIWLIANVTFCPRTARAYMQLAALDPSKRQRVANLPLREALLAIRNRDEKLASAEARENRPSPGPAIVVVGPGADREWPPVVPATPDEIADDLVAQLEQAAVVADHVTADHLRAACKRRFDEEPVPEAPDNDPGDDEQTIWRRGLMFRAQEAVSLAAFEDWSQFKVDDQLVLAVFKAAGAWCQLHKYLRELNSGSPIPRVFRPEHPPVDKVVEASPVEPPAVSDDDLGIPDFLLVANRLPPRAP